ncbi:MAG: hypothetical protein EBT15_07025 [Betaproteobacteria bacterium]|nr:hypothetical protein [Betaproteobacteria bacterium]
MVGKVTPDDMASASGLPALIGVSKYRSPNDELNDKIRAIKGEPRDESDTNEAMGWGNLMEPIILRQAAERLGLEELELDHPEPYFHGTWPLACSLDGLANGNGQVIASEHNRGIFVIGQDEIKLEGKGVLEAKLTSIAPEEIPALYRGPLQLQAQMAIVGATWGAVCVLYQGTELRVFLFAPHDRTIELIEKTVYDFQGRLDKFKQTGEIDYYPPVNSKDADRMFPEAVDEVVNLDDSATELARQILAAQHLAKQAEADRQKAEAALKAMLGNAARGIAGDFEIRWPMRSYKAQPEKVVPAKEAYTIRQSTLSVKEMRT